ncbi:MAG: energy transducer TonB, partial [Acidobacteriota bacterium]|nr:energy transducer TonB [Acidobacteriota bacterium]
GEGFAVLMPRQPASQPSQARAGGLKAEGRRYAAAGEDGSSYIVWSLKETSGRGAQEYAEGQPRGAASPYLDDAAELAWQLLIAPEVERLRKNPEAAKEAYFGMTYGHGFDLDGHPAREYAVGLKKERGPVYVCADAEHIYVVAALGADAQSPQLRQFVNSFGFGPVPKHTAVTTQVDPMLIKPDPRDIPYGLPNSAATPPSSGPGAGGGAGQYNVGSGDAPVDYNRPFTQREVTRKAVITYKPEPPFTEGARKFSVTGVVRLRAILAATGEVTGITVVKWLPHGLTENAIAAAKQIRFTPAQKDGRAVSQYIVFEYNFNIY